MTEVEKLEEAERRWTSGDAPGSMGIYLDVCINGRDDQTRLQSALVLVERLKAVEHMETFLEVCDTGIACAQRTSDALSEAYLLGKKATGLAFLNGTTLVPARRRLRMAPGWFGFSLERDEAEHVELTNKVGTTEAEIAVMLAKAEVAAEQAGSHATKAHVLLCAGQVHFNRYMNLKLENLKGVAKVPRFLLELLRPYRLDDFLHFTKDERAKMDACLNKCETAYLAAADSFQQGGDEPGAGYAYFNLANDLRSAYRFRKAKKYLALAKKIAEQHRDNNLLRSIGVVDKSIRVRNRDIPNYLAGEKRETAP